MPQAAQFHLVHGEEDGVVPARCSIEASHALRALGADVTLDLLPGLGHGIDGRALRVVLGYLASRHPRDGAGPRRIP